MHVGSDYYGGISGYQEQSLSPQLPRLPRDRLGYPGAGAVTATFISMATQTGWGGYVFTEHSSYTGISATFTIPSLSGEAGALCSVWVGLGNVYQTGIYLSYNTGFTGNADTSPWSWWIPGAGELWNHHLLPHGRRGLADAHHPADRDRLADDDHQQHRGLDVHRGQVRPGDQRRVASRTPPPDPRCGLTRSPRRKIIIEKEGSDANPDYGSIAFTSITTTPAISVAPNGILTVNTGIDQYPGQFNLGSGSFTMFWNGYT